MIKILSIPILRDNYSYLIINQLTKKAMVIDPAEPEKVIQVIKQEKLDLTSILCVCITIILSLIFSFIIRLIIILIILEAMNI
jgi:hypothetical protein